MADVAWARKYRPVSFNDYIGEDVKKLVVNRFRDRDNIPNTIMLYGTRGTGKTSMARLLSKEIHCLNPIDGHSCGVCDMCKEIDEYISFTEAGAECAGVTEVDAATTNGKDDINDIVEDAISPPLYPLRYKVVILDECHMLSVSAQNSLLKVIEEPPSHLVFILCTTDPEKVIGTIHSRIQLKIEVKRKSVSELADKLMHIAQLENLTTNRSACEIIAKKGNRIPRECIGILEKVAKSTGGSVLISDIKSMLDDVDNDIYVEYFNIINPESSDIGILEKVCIFYSKLQEKDISGKQFISGLSSFVLDAIKIRHGVNIEDYPVEFLKKVKDATKVYKTENEFLILLKTISDAYRKIDSDDVKSELNIMIMSLELSIHKITGKAALYDNLEGIGDQSDRSSDENRLSVRRYQSMINEMNNNSLNNLSDIGLDKSELVGKFSRIVDMGASEEVGIEKRELSDRDRRILEIFDSAL